MSNSSKTLVKSHIYDVPSSLMQAGQVLATMKDSVGELRGRDGADT
jgi:hypothetical protein